MQQRPNFKCLSLKDCGWWMARKEDFRISSNIIAQFCVFNCGHIFLRKHTNVYNVRIVEHSGKTLTKKHNTDIRQKRTSVGKI